MVGQEQPRRDIDLVEAALYVAGRPLDLKTLGSVIKTRSKRRVQEVARALVKEYEKRNTALEILELEDKRFVMQLKAEYAPGVRKLSIRPLLTPGPLKTLSYIAYRQPVLQTQVVDVRGRHVYGHLKQLEDMGLIDRERVKKTNVLRTTDFFADYFSLSRNLRTMKSQLGGIFKGIANSQEP